MLRMTLLDYMRERKISEQAMAELVGGISRFGIRKLMYGERNASLRIAARIQEVTGGAVAAISLVKREKDAA